MHAHAYLLGGSKNDTRLLFLTFFVSAVFHLLIFLVLIFAYSHTPGKKFARSVINVDLVTLPEPNSKPNSQQPITAGSKQQRKEKTKKIVKAPSLQKNVQVNQKRSEAVSVASENKKIKTSLKKKTFKSSRVVKNAIDRIKKKSEESRPAPVAEAIDRLKNSLDKMKAINQLKNKISSGVNDGRGINVNTGSGRGSKEALKLIDIYRIEIAYQIQKKWAFSEQLAGRSNNLQASLVFKVMPNGEIKDIWFTDRSGNNYLDESAYKAIIKSNPVEPHPVGVGLPYVNVGLRFTPRGVN